LFNRVQLNKLKSQSYIQQKNIIRFIKERRTIKALHIFRNYSALIVVISSALLVSATNFASGKESSGFLFGYFGTQDNYENPLANKMSLQTNNQSNLALVQLAQASTAPDPTIKADSFDESITIQGQSLVSATGPVRQDPEEDGGVKIYEVATGDTLGSIAREKKITVNTILWANNLDNADSIMPGDKLFILPVSGLAYTVKKNDTLDSIVAKYKADRGRIIAFNDLPANGEITEGQEITIPDGEKEVIAPRPTTPTTSTTIAARPYETFQPTAGKKLDGRAGAGHKFPFGYCTWYVAQKRYVPWSGNAGTWLYHAKSAGYATGKTPRVGAIMVSSESWWGHVAVVESVSGSEYTVSEMNYRGFAKKSYRTVSTGSRVVKGFIY